MEQQISELYFFQWFISNLMNTVKRMSTKYRNQIKTAMEIFCEETDRDCDEIWDSHMDSKLYEAEWLKDILAPEKPTFYNCCKYIGDEVLYEDFRHACGFVHAQGVTNKMGSFVLYESIYYNFFLMMTYIFKTLQLFNTCEEAEQEMNCLEIQLAELYGFWEKE